MLHDRRIRVLYRRWEAPREVERVLEPPELRAELAALAHTLLDVYES